MTKGQKKGESPLMRVFEMYETRILELIAEGYKQFEIAEMTPPLSKESVNKYLDGIKKKYGARNTPHLIHLWHEKGKTFNG